MTNQGDATADDELWTPGQAVAYLNAGGMKLGFRPRRLTDMIKRGELAGIQTHPNGWRRTPALGIRRLRYQLLAELGITDPDWAPPAEGRHRNVSTAPEDAQGPDQGTPSAD